MARKVRLKYDPKKKGGKIIKFFFFLLLISFLGVIIYLLFFSGYLAVANINIAGQENISESDIRNEIEGEISGKWLGIVPKNNQLLIHPLAVENKLSQKFRKIDWVAVRRKFPSELFVQIKERKLALVFKSGEKRFILDEKGEAFEEISAASPEYNLPDLMTLEDTSNHDVIDGKSVIDPAVISFMTDISKKMSTETDMEISREFVTPNRISGDLRVETSAGWKIFFDASLDASKEIGMLKTVLDEKIPHDQRVNLEYIDLRVDNKVFYKFKEGAQEEVKSEESARTASQSDADGEKKPEEQVKGEEKKKKKK